MVDKKTQETDRSMAERIMDIVGHRDFHDNGDLRANKNYLAEFVVAGLAVVASEVKLAAERQTQKDG